MKKLFQAFSQENRSKGKYGTGLGMAISQRFCQLMGGSIRATSKPGRGSAFAFAYRTEPEREQMLVSGLGFKPC